MKKFNVTGMSCAACSARVEKAVKSISGVSSCAVSLLTNSMTVDGDIDPKKVIAAVEGAGYGASLADGASLSESGGHKDKETKRLLARLLWSIGLSLVLMYLSMGHTMWGFPLPEVIKSPVILSLLQGVLALSVMIINKRFFINGAKGALHGAPNMDTLVSLGSGASFIYSAVLTALIIFATSRGDMSAAHAHLHGLYFESAAMILALITLGKLLEAHSKGRTTSALRALIDLAPKTATVLVDGNETVIDAKELKVGDVFVVRAGESFAADGVVIDGSGAVDESSLTGESIPVDKSVGDAVSAATLNRSGYLVCRAERVGAETSLSKIIKTVSDAASSKAPIAKIADRVSGVFVPAVLAIAFVTSLIWILIDQNIGHALARGICVLVISCPCALGLATPVAIMVGSGVGAKGGVLFKSATSLETAGKARTVILDKTGTITCGSPEVTDIYPVAESDELLEVAFSLERKSEHPLARAVVDYCEKKNMLPLELSDFNTLAGSGVEGEIDGERVFGSNMRLAEQRLGELDKNVSSAAETYAADGKTPLIFCRGDKILGIIAVADRIKPDSAEAISQLRGMGIKTVMLTGDNSRTAAAVARAVGVDEVISDVLPNGKAEIVEKYRRDGVTVMVGDGINDAPALARADIGIAIGAGTEVAIDAADVVLMKSNPTDVAAAIRLSRQTLRNIKENLFWAFFYNVIGIPLAAGAWISLLGWEMQPMFGAAAMSISSFCVVMNALRLNLFDMHSARRDKKIAIKAKKDKKENKKMTITLTIEGMMCPHCEARVKKYLEATSGVVSATVSHVSGTAIVETDGSVDGEKLKGVVTELDYKVSSVK